jgi:signal transduction histidine kinase
LPGDHPGLDADEVMTDNSRVMTESNAQQELERLRDEVAMLRSSRKRFALTSDDQRRSIERELHHGLQQLLVGLATSLELAALSIEADPAMTKRLLAELERDIRQALEETRRLAYRIYPPLLDEGGFAVALRSAAVSANVPIRIDVAAATRLPSEIAGAVYFSCLDVLERAAAGTPVTVTIRSDGGELAFEVLADCDVDIERLRDRIEAFGGRLSIESGSGKPTRVAGALPLPG